MVHLGVNYQQNSLDLFGKVFVLECVGVKNVSDATSHTGV